MICDLTQAEMAKLLGVTRETVDRVENGRLKMSRRLAIKYTLATGCDLEEGDGKRRKGLYGAHGKPMEVRVAWHGEPYTRELFLDHRRSVESVRKLEPADRRRANEAAISLLMDAAQATDLLEDANEAIREFVADLFVEFELNDHFKGSLQAFKYEHLMRTNPTWAGAEAIRTGLKSGGDSLAEGVE